MKPTADQPQAPPRWLYFLGLWQLLSVVWASQLYFGGHVKSWSAAFAQEAVYWLSWGIISPLIFWLCRRLHGEGRKWHRYAGGLLLGAIATAFLQPVILQFITYSESWLAWKLSISKEQPVSFFTSSPLTAIQLAGLSLTIYAAIALAWHALTYYREARDRQVKSLELESLLYQARLDALRSQLNPHFLFNTLHSIAEFIEEDPKLAEQLILRLGELLRRVLTYSAQQETALADEIEFVKAYLEIEQARLCDRLQVQWEIASDVLHAWVPSMILQPLVENAIQHGIAPSKRAGKLWINARCESGFLHLQVRDNGPGITEAGKRPSAGIGLSNTGARLQRLYGERHRFELLNNDGLEVNIRLPFNRQPVANYSNENSHPGS